jgi:hypothetical protein
VMLDTGTNNEDLLEDPFYLGMQHPRLRGDDFFSLVDEFMQAVKHRWPKCLVQFEVSAVLIGVMCAHSYSGCTVTMHYSHTTHSLCKPTFVTNVRFCHYLLCVHNELHTRTSLATTRRSCWKSTATVTCALMTTSKVSGLQV